MLGPLHGVRVIDLSAVVSGPFGTSILADQGADVISVESVHAPDIVRNAGPSVESARGVSAFWAAMNRNKRSAALNLRHATGKQILKDLVREADVVVQNFRPGVLDRMGLGWDVLSAINPQLVMCSVSGFGSDGRRTPSVVASERSDGRCEHMQPTDGGVEYGSEAEFG